MYRRYGRISYATVSEKPRTKSVDAKQGFIMRWFGLEMLNNLSGLLISITINNKLQLLKDVDLFGAICEKSLVKVYHNYDLT